MSKIKSIHAYEIIDSRSYPTIEATLTLDTGQEVTTSIPAGTSIGKYEAVELRDNQPDRFEGMGVSLAVSYINDLLAPKLSGVSPLKQQEIDAWLIEADGTSNKNKLGANSVLTISQLIAKAGAVVSEVPLYKYINQLLERVSGLKIPMSRIPPPIFDIINGGKHANNNLDFQEFEIIPSSSFSFSRAYEVGIELFHELKRVLEYRNASVSVGEEGGFSPNFSTNMDAIEVINETVQQKKLQLGVDIFLGLDIAANHFYKEDKYYIKDKPHPLKTTEYISFILSLFKKYSILYIEDPIHEDDWDGWKKLNSLIDPSVYLVGDDLLGTNKDRLAKSIHEKACSAVLLKLNQIGTITETLEVVDMAKKNNFCYIMSNRSGETNDTFISDFAVGIQAEFVKFGAPSRGERVGKYNRLWQIERDELK